jgi:uncharacterized membrane protein
MKRSLILWGFLLVVAGFLLFRFGITTFYPESVQYARAGALNQFWHNLTVAQKLFIAAMELPFFAGILLVFAGFIQLLNRKPSPAQAPPAPPTPPTAG